jgi:predicted membrane protein
MKRLIRILGRVFLVLLTLQIVVFIVARIAERRLPRTGDEESEEFDRAAIMNGVQFDSRASAFRRGSVTAVLGGAQIDLREATLDPEGARLELRTTLGGVQVIVPPTWRVELVGDPIKGEHDLDLPDQDDLPEDAPRLVVVADTKYGGVQVTAEEQEFVARIHGSNGDGPEA